MNLIALWRLLSTLSPLVRDIVIALVNAIAGSPNPEEAAKRALEEVTRLRLFDETMRRVHP